MVLDYPETGTKEYLPAEHITETVDLWGGTALTYVHPENRTQTVRDPDAFMGTVIGAFHDPTVLDSGGKLRGNGVIDVEKAEALGGNAAKLVELLQRGEQVSVSAGYATMNDKDRSGQFDGDQYDLVQGPPLPDHIAVFPSDSQVQARCSPEDGCVAPKRNAHQYGQAANQRANNGVRANMSKMAMNGGSTVFPNKDEREKAIQTIQRELPNIGPDIRQNGDKDLLMIAQGVGYSLPECDCNGSCDCYRNNARRQSHRRANMAAVPGRMSRDLDTDQSRGDDPEEYPAGGRSSWERRKVGLDDTPNDSDTFPAGGRSAWEQRKKTKQTSSSDGTSTTANSSTVPTGTRSSYQQRRNATSDDEEVKSWLDSEYPLAAKRHAKEREKRRKRRQDLQEQFKRNEARYQQQKNGDQ
ncbi:hypothetical protein DMJ13_03545 [halophilic archaeon]|nr:hypothetical protein DMJ13_03545 [halophilic archaeon]